MSKEPLFFHLDLDAFFASVEQLDNPQYKGKPLIVGGLSKRDVVSTCSYEARAFGVHSAMPAIKAQALCPHGIFIKPRMGRYSEKSKEVMDILYSFSPSVQQMSIDEAFLDMTGTEKLFGDAYTTAMSIKKSIYDKTGLTASIGVGSNKYIAKIASDKNKPNGLYIVPFGAEKEFMGDLALKEIWGIGSKTREKLVLAGITSIKEVLALSESLLQSIIGIAAGSLLYNVIRGNSTNIFNEEQKSKSISTERTFEIDISNSNDIRDILFELSSEIMYRLIHEHIKSKTIHLKIRYADFKTVSIQETGDVIQNTEEFYKRVLDLFHKKFDIRKEIRLIGIGALNIEDNKKSEQLPLFTSEKQEKIKKIEETMVALSQKKGGIVLKRARLLKSKKKQ